MSTRELPFLLFINYNQQMDTVPGESSGPLSEEQLEQVAVARERVQSVKGAVSLARFNFWCYAIAAALSAPLVYFYPSNIVAVICLVWVAAVERRGGRLLQQLQPRGGLVLIYNQLTLLVLIAAYCIWKIVEAQSGPTPFDEMLSPDSTVAQLLGTAGLSGGLENTGTLGDVGELNQMFRTGMTLFYIVIIVVTALFLGGFSLYYFRRYRQLQDFMVQTPDWVRAVLRAAS
jgi:hypothetical protein